MQRLDAFGALIEPGFRMAPAAVFLHGAGIFSAAELSAQPLSLALAMQEQRGDDRAENHDESDD